MQCDTCGLLLESVDEENIVKGGRFSRVEIYCERHKPLREVFV